MGPDPVRIKAAAAILGVTVEQIKERIRAFALSTTGPGGGYVQLGEALASLRAAGIIVACPCCGSCSSIEPPLPAAPPAEAPAE